MLETENYLRAIVALLSLNAAVNVFSIPSSVQTAPGIGATIFMTVLFAALALFLTAERGRPEAATDGA